MIEPVDQPATQPPAAQVCWTSADLALLPENGTRYEIIAGDLYMSKQPHWHHQETCGIIFRELFDWASANGQGRVSLSPGVIFSDYDNVAPDVVWMSNERFAALLDAAGHMTGAPELVVEVLSPGERNERRDREVKRKLYSQCGVQEYWIVDWQVRQVEVYRRSEAALQIVATLFAADELRSPLLPGFACPVARLLPAGAE